MLSGKDAARLDEVAGQDDLREELLVAGAEGGHPLELRGVLQFRDDHGIPLVRELKDGVDEDVGQLVLGQFLASEQGGDHSVVSSCANLPQVHHVDQERDAGIFNTVIHLTWASHR
jgi:hypothetical protein